jgi:glycosyltransferase involved in cell wall biosynthesis
VTRLHQVLSGAGPYDAVTNQAAAWRSLLERWDLAGGTYADAIDPRVRGVEDLERLRPAPGDALVIHYSAYAPRVRRLLELPHRKLLVYHNVTPPRYLWKHHARVAVLCSLGRGQLPAFARSVDVAAAVSAFNARELEGVGAPSARVVPILHEPDRLERRGAPPGGEGPLVLCVGRLVPNKRHDLVVEAFAAWQRAHAPDARLLCVGEALTDAYGGELERLARAAGAEGVTFAGGLRQGDLNAAYAAADVMLSLSEHEGFCIPLLEAFHFGLPVVARPAGGMPEVGGDAVLWTGDQPFDPAVVAELLELAVRDGELRGELARRGRERLAAYSPERTADRVREAVDATLSGAASASASSA